MFCMVHRLYILCTVLFVRERRAFLLGRKYTMRGRTVKGKDIMVLVWALMMASSYAGHYGVHSEAAFWFWIVVSLVLVACISHSINRDLRDEYLRGRRDARHDLAWKMTDQIRSVTAEIRKYGTR